MSGASTDPFASARDNLRDTIKWLATALGALAVALIAGLSLGSLSGLAGPPLYLALSGAAIGIGCVISILWIFLGLLIPKPFVLDDVLEDAREDQDFKARASQLLPAEIRNDVEWFVNERKRSIEHIYANRGNAQAYRNEKDFIESTNIFADRLRSFGMLSRLSRNLKRRQMPIGILVTLSFIGLGILSSIPPPIASPRGLECFQSNSCRARAGPIWRRRSQPCVGRLPLSRLRPLACRSRDGSRSGSWHPMPVRA